MAVVLDAVQDLTASLDALCAADPAQFADPETIQALHRQAERLNAVAARAMRRFDAGRAWEADGARSAAAWLAVRCRLPVPTARRGVQLGRALRHMSAVEAAWLAGDIGEAHAFVFAAARTPATAAHFERDEALLIAQASELRYHHFARVLAYWGQRVDPGGTDEHAEAQSTTSGACTCHRPSGEPGCSTACSIPWTGPSWPRR